MTLPKSEALAQQAMTDADNALWEHAYNCAPCFEGIATAGPVRGLCSRGWILSRALSEATDQHRNWHEYDRWLNHGGHARYLANDWIA